MARAAANLRLAASSEFGVALLHLHCCVLVMLDSRSPDTHPDPSDRPLPRHFLTGAELSAAELDGLIARALELKGAPASSDALAKRTVALIFQRPSTRTRVSFEAGIAELGGHPMVLRTDDLQLTRGESIRDTAYVLSRHVAAIGIRTGPDELVAELAKHASVPVINMLTAGHHPCQALADLVTLRETFGRLEGLTLAYIGDGNNVARSLAVLGSLAGVHVRIASPPGYALAEPVAHALLSGDPLAAVAGADAVYTDVWVSMSNAPESAAERRKALAPYRIDDELLDLAAPHAIALHCLPAHPGEEITADVLYGPRQRIWQQAENRRHAQKALLELLTQ
jgi:ornithine carbamoyltransferase